MLVKHSLRRVKDVVRASGRLLGEMIAGSGFVTNAAKIYVVFSGVACVVPRK